MNMPNMAGITQSIMRLVEACLGSALGMVVIFCWTQVETPTRMGRRGVVSGRERSSQRKRWLRGMASCTWLSQG